MSIAFEKIPFDLDRLNQSSVILVTNSGLVLEKTMLWKPQQQDGGVIAYIARNSIHYYKKNGINVDAAGVEKLDQSMGLLMYKVISGSSEAENVQA